MHTAHEGPPKTSMLLNSFWYTKRFFVQAIFKDVSNGNDRIPTGLKKSLYESFALEADLKVWLLGKTQSSAGQPHDLICFSNFSFWNVDCCSIFGRELLDIQQNATRDKPQKPPQPENIMTPLNNPIRRIRQLISHSVRLFSCLVEWGFNGLTVLIPGRQIHSVPSSEALLCTKTPFYISMKCSGLLKQHSGHLLWWHWLPCGAPHQRRTAVHGRSPSDFSLNGKKTDWASNLEITTLDVINGTLPHCSVLTPESQRLFKTKAVGSLLFYRKTTTWHSADKTWNRLNLRLTKWIKRMTAWHGRREVLLLLYNNKGITAA